MALVLENGIWKLQVASSGPAAADTTYTLSPAAAGSYTLDSSAMAAVGGSALVGDGLGFEGAQAQVPAWTTPTSITDSSDGVTFVPGNAGAGFPMTVAAQDAEAAGYWMKMGAFSMNPLGQFDIVARVSFPTASSSTGVTGLGIAMWTQSATAYQSRAQWWGWGGNGTLDYSIKARPVLSAGVAPKNVGWQYDRVTLAVQSSAEFWLRWQRTADNEIEYSWREAEDNAWTVVDFGPAGAPMSFNGTSVQCGPGIAMHSTGTYRIVSFTADYVAVV
tara:strand:+ start:27 stop:851 length:825 start_codon:yes stop_codon:yes gene_type:complete